MRLRVLKDKDALLEYNRQWIKNNPEKIAEYNAARRAKRKLNPPTPKPKTEEELAYNREYNKTHKDKLNAYRRARYAFDSATVRNQTYKSRYGITLEDYNNMYEAQSGLCAICFKSSGARRLSVDHNHTTGAVRGLLCHRCNTSLGLLNDDVNVLLSAIKYLGQWDTE